MGLSEIAGMYQNRRDPGYSRQYLAMRLLMLSQHFPPEIGGIQTYAHGLSRALASQLEHFRVVVPHGRLRGPGIVAVGPKIWVPWNAVYPLLYFGGLKGYDTVLTSHWHMAPIALAARRLGLVQRVFTAAHGRELLFCPWPASLTTTYERLRKWVFHQLDGAFPVSHYTAELVESLGCPRVEVLSNGVSWREPPAGPASNPPFILTVTRLIERKGIDNVMRALALMHRDYPELRYFIAGEGPERKNLQELARALGVDHLCRFLGRVSDQQRDALYRDCRFLVMTPRQAGGSVEGFGLVYREANLFGKAVIGSRSGGVVEAVRHDFNGLLVPPQDEAALAEAMAHLLSRPEEARRMGRQGQEWVRREGTWEAVAARLIGLLQVSVGGG